MAKRAGGGRIRAVQVLIGTSGWQYRDWRGRFYPERLPQRCWLGHYADRFATVELNNSFYRLPERSSFEHWRETVPEDFVVAVKASRYLTHVKRLKDPEEPVARLMHRLEGLGDRLGPVLVQLPPNLKEDTEALGQTLRAFPRSVRVAVEVRHPTWWEGGAALRLRRVLERHRAAWVLGDGGPAAGSPSDRAAGRPGDALAGLVTTDWTYIRFHKGTSRSPEYCYTRAALDVWAQRLSELEGSVTTSFCYFNNDPNGCAPRDARWWAGAVSRAGMDATRVPARSETPVGRPAQSPRSMPAVSSIVCMNEDAPTS